MSGKISGMVWDLDLPHPELLVLLAITDHANHDGRNMYPGVALLAWKTGYSARTVVRILNKLIERGILVRERQPGRPGVGRRRCVEASAVGVAVHQHHRRQLQPDHLRPALGWRGAMCWLEQLVVGRRASQLRVRVRAVRGGAQLRRADVVRAHVRTSTALWGHRRVHSHTPAHRHRTAGCVVAFWLS